LSRLAGKAGFDASSGGRTKKRARLTMELARLICHLAAGRDPEAA
jgi:hypothetical protein